MIENYTKVTVAILVLYCDVIAANYLFGNCGGLLTEPKGIIHSPNFPREFPTPIRCEWVIHNRVTNLTNIYFTQFYLKGYVSVWQYQEYHGPLDYLHEWKIATVDAQAQIHTIPVQAPFTVIRFGVNEMDDIHIRVLDHLIDVYGFNITYEFSDTFTYANKLTCSAHECSYLGNCLAGADFSEYRCHCFDGYYGEFCEYGPECHHGMPNQKCQNSGECRLFFSIAVWSACYYTGSHDFVCTCPVGYTGTYCENKEDACYYLDCQQLCIKDSTGSDRCACFEDFRLDSNGKTCNHIDRVKIDVQFEGDLKSIIFNISRGDELQRNQTIVENVVDYLKDHGILTAERFELNNSGSNIKSLQLYVEDDEEKKTLDAFRNLGIHENPNNNSFKITVTPALYLIDVAAGKDSSNDTAYALEGKYFTISCLVRGSRNVKFLWYKDDMVINMSLTSRDGYQTVIKSNYDDTIRSVMYYDRVEVYDAGKYTCLVIDEEDKQNKSVLVEVLKPPLVHIEPRAGFISKNGSIRIPCLSLEDTHVTVEYQWFENGTRIKKGNQNLIIESLYPQGSQLFVRHLNNSAVFRCSVTNLVGTVGVTSHIFKTHEYSQKICDAEVYMNMSWPAITGGQFAKQKCPNDTGGFITRKCFCSGSGKQDCHWAEPNSLGCQSLELINIYNELEIVRLGYISTTLNAIFAKLYHFVDGKNYTIHFGDIELSSSILRQLLLHLSEFPIPVLWKTKILLGNVINLMDSLLALGQNVSTDANTEYYFGLNILRIADHISSGLIRHLETQTMVNLKTRNIDVAEIVAGNENITFWEGLFNANETELKKKDFDVFLFVFRNLETHLQSKSRICGRGSSHKTLSDLYAVYPSSQKQVPHNMDMIADVKIPIQSSNEEVYELHCLSWNQVSREPSDDTWLNSTCRKSSFDLTSVTCRCTLPVRLIVTRSKKNTYVVHGAFEKPVNMYMFVGFMLVLNAQIAVLIILIYHWRYLVGEYHLYHINSTFSLACKDVIFVLCLVDRDYKILCMVGRIFAYLFYLSSLSFILLEVFHYCFILTVQYKKEKRCSKYVIIGWGIPILITVFFSATSKLFATSIPEHSLLCWISTRHWYFYIFAVPVLCTITIFISVSLIVWKLHVKVTEEHEAFFKKNLIIMCSKNFALLILVSAEAFLSMDLSDDKILQIVCLILTKFLLVSAVFILRCVLDKQMMTKVWNCKISKHMISMVEEHQRPARDSYKEERTRLQEPRERPPTFPFMRPERISNKTSRQKSKAALYFKEMNRTKYTREKKQQLSSLLGSSRTDYCTGDNRTDSTETRSNAGYNRTDSTETRSSRLTNSSVDTYVTDLSSDKEIRNIPAASKKKCGKKVVKIIMEPVTPRTTDKHCTALITPGTTEKHCSASVEHLTTNQQCSALVIPQANENHRSVLSSNKYRKRQQDVKNGSRIHEMGPETMIEELTILIHSNI